MRVVSYNILDGGEGRADPLAEVIQSQRPDVVALVEADHADVVARIARRLDMDVIEAVGRKHRAALLSRYAIRESINHSLLHDDLSDCFLEATLTAPDGQTWSVGVVHLHAGAKEADQSRREKEIDVVLKAFAGHRQSERPHLLAGDFNSNSPVQRIDPAACKPRTREEWIANGGSVPSALRPEVAGRRVR